MNTYKHVKLGRKFTKKLNSFPLRNRLYIQLDNRLSSQLYNQLYTWLQNRLGDERDTQLRVKLHYELEE